MGDRRFAAGIMVLVVLAAFGPYLAGGVRTEQAVIYGLLVAILPFRFLSMHIPRAGGRIIAAWTVYVVAAVVGVAFPINRTRWVEQSVFAGFDNLMLPLALTALVWSVVPQGRAAAALVFACRTIAVAAAANGLLAMLMTRVDMTAVVRPFVVSPDTNVQSVADLAAQMGRFSGVFNQPAEAGLAYGVAGLAACFGWRHRPTVMYLLLCPIILGGLLCVSKAFVLCGLPLIIWTLIRVSRRWLSAVFVGCLAALAVMQSGFLTQWSGFQFLARLFDPSSSSGLLTLYSAGRFGDQSTLSKVIATVWADSPVFGFGAAGLRVPYDNGWVEALVVGGLVGAIAFSLAIFALLVMARTDADRERRRFMTSVTILVVAASLGLPALTANRAGSLVWLVIALAALAHERRRSPAPLLDAQTPPAHARPGTSGPPSGPRSPDPA